MLYKNVNKGHAFNGLAVPLKSLRVDLPPDRTLFEHPVHRHLKLYAFILKKNFILADFLFFEKFFFFRTREGGKIFFRFACWVSK